MQGRGVGAWRNVIRDVDGSEGDMGTVVMVVMCGPDADAVDGDAKQTILDMDSGLRASDGQGFSMGRIFVPLPLPPKARTLRHGYGLPAMGGRGSTGMGGYGIPAD
jgi:hypothetical protein